jgi:hypothetical protein
MVSTTIAYKIKATTDTYARDVGRAFDTNCPLTAQPSKGPAQFYIGNTPVPPTEFDYTETVDLDYGTHTVCVTLGTYDPYQWQVEVLVNGKSLGVQSPVNMDHQYSATFTLTKPPPTMEETISGLISTMIPIMMLMIILPMLTSVMKAFTKKE